MVQEASLDKGSACEVPAGYEAPKPVVMMCGGGRWGTSNSNPRELVRPIAGNVARARTVSAEASAFFRFPAEECLDSPGRMKGYLSTQLPFYFN